MSRRHPTGLTLSRYADGELEGREEREVARHLEGCDECRDYVAFIHELAAAVDEERPDETSPAPSLAADYDLAAEVLRRRRAGERVALPVPGATAADTGDGRGRGGRRFTPAWRAGFGIAAGFVLLALAAIYLFEAPPAAAGHSELDFGTELAAPGSTLDVVYTPAVFLAGYDSLRLRVRSRTKDTPVPGRAQVLGDLRTFTLRRGDDGKFRGSLDIGPDEVFLAAAVEDFSGRDVDTNFGRLWDVLVSTDSVPSTAALESQVRTLAQATNWVAASAEMTKLAERYPDNPLVWSLLFYHLEQVDPNPIPDSVLAIHRAKLRELVDHQSRQGTTPEDLLMLFAYARWLDEPAVADSLLDVAERLDPRNPVVAMWRLPNPMEGAGAWLERAEQIWATSDQSDDGFVISALFVAGRAGDLPAVRRWTRRGEELGYLSPEKMARALDGFDFAAGERVRLRREWLAQLRDEGDEDRPLNMSIPEFRQWKRDETDRTETELGRDLALVGDTTASGELLASVAETAWQPSLLQPYADFLLAAGDTTKALDVIGVLAADPVSGVLERERYDAVLDLRVDDRSVFLEQGMSEYLRRIRRDVDFDRRLPARTPLHFADGRTSTAGQRLSGSVTLLVFFQSQGPGVESGIASALEGASSLPGDDLSVLLVARNAAPEIERRFPSADLVIDQQLDLTQRLRAWGSEDFVIVDSNLDATNRSDLDDALRIAGALLTE